MSPQFFWSAVCTGALFGALAAWPQATTPTPRPGVQTPVRQPRTSPPPSAPVPERSQPTSASPSQPTPESNAQATPPMSDTQADDASQPAATDSGDVDASATTRRRVAEAEANGDDEQLTGRDCRRLRGLEKSECERRDNARDDLPAGVTNTQKP